MSNSESINMPVSTSTTKDNSELLIDIANNTFRELCKTLEHEQEKLLDLEERRKKLYDEMQRLRAEIEEEKHIYKLNIMESVSENLCNLNKAMETTCTSSTIDALKNSDPTESIDEFIMRQRSKLERINKSMDKCLANAGQIEIYEIEEDNDESENNPQNNTLAITHNEDNLNTNTEHIDNDDNDGHANNLENELKIAITASVIDKCLDINESEESKLLCNDDCIDKENNNDDNKSDTVAEDRNIDNDA